MESASDQSALAQPAPTGVEGIARRWRLFAPLLRDDAVVFRTRFAATRDDPQQLLTFLLSQRLAATVAARIEELGLVPDLPRDLVEPLRAERRAQFVLAAENLETAIGLHALLDGLGVRHLLLKGPLLGLRIYGGIDRRTVGDIDLLVDPETVDRAESALRDAGWTGRYGVLGGRRLSRFFTHHYAYAKGRQALELHWLPLREAGLRLDREAIWGRAGSIDFAGTALPVPDLETILLLQLLGAAKDLELGTFRLRAVVDIRQLAIRLGDGFDWRRFFRRTSGEGAGRLAAAMLELSRRLLEWRDEASGLDGALGEMLHSHSLGSLDLSRDDLGLEVFAALPPSWNNKRRLFPLHRRGRVWAWTWWAISGRFREAVYLGR